MLPFVVLWFEEFDKMVKHSAGFLYGYGTWFVKERTYCSLGFFSAVTIYVYDVTLCIYGK